MMRNEESSRGDSIIVVVEDNTNDARFLLKVIEKVNGGNNKVVLLKDGSEAINYFFNDSENAKNENIKVVFLDINIPKVNGLEVLKEIKSSNKTKHIPTVVLTSSGQDKDVKKSIELGANSYVVKPIEYTRYSEKMKKLCDYWCNLNTFSTNLFV